MTVPSRSGYAIALVLLAVIGLTGAGLPPGAWPLDGPVVREFDPPAKDWQPGHRGLDLGASPGTTVSAAAAGRVSFVGRIAGRDVLVIDHGDVRTTYEPVRASVAVGDRVDLGDPVGELQAGHPCGAAAACLHWGLKRGEAYLDPRDLLGSDPARGDVRMLPGDARKRAEEAARARREQAQAGGGLGRPSPPGEHGFSMPVPGPVTSPFGMRVHPITGVRKLHDGTDWGAGCGTPIRAPYAGTVTTVTFTGAWGNRLILDHGMVDGRAVRTSYNHALGYTVRPGQRVAAGQVIGRVGSTGYSTGCHLHLQLWLDGGIVDPLSWF